MAKWVYWCSVLLVLIVGLPSQVESRSVRERRFLFSGWKTDTEKSGFTSDEEAAIVEIHNDLRLRVNASDMRKQSWDPGLAMEAQSWAAGCDYASKNATTYGENLAAQPLFFNETKAVENWYSEGQYYVYSNNSCTHSCEHYTQVVLAEASRIGCGIKYCSTFTTLTLSNAYFIVCYYDHAYSNSRVPYKEGVVCSNCPTEAPICDNFLCRPRNMNDTTTTQTTTLATTTTATTTTAMTTATTTAIATTIIIPSHVSRTSTYTTEASFATKTVTVLNRTDAVSSDIGVLPNENTTITNSARTTLPSWLHGVTRGETASVKRNSWAVTSCFSVVSVSFVWLLSQT